MTSIQKGDFVKISYTLKVKEEGQIFDTTNEEIARKVGIFDEKKKYGPKLVILGNEEFFPVKRLNDELIGLKEGEEFVVEVPPEETFGYKDPSKIKMLGRKELVSKGISPIKVGKTIQWGNQTGTIISALGGRIRVDFNHPLVGKTIVYEGKVDEKITAFQKKIEALIDYRKPGIDISQLKINSDKGEVIITMPEEVITKEIYLQLIKIRLANDIHKNFPDRKEIKFIDIYTFDESPESNSKED
ncbi:MAG: peptidylprolyl isomerase [Candidatus Heimdallarchaeota archaeon]|nr:peptidylprolyl isomerase [Candidatus Heimdallarchaeota archaeon]